MDKVREYAAWLFKHPIAFAWILAFIAIILNWLVSGNSHAPEAKGTPHSQMAEANQGKADHGKGEKPEHGAKGEKAEHEGKGKPEHNVGEPATKPEATNTTAPAPVANNVAPVESAAVPAPAPVANAAPMQGAVVATAPAATSTTVVDQDPVSLLRAARQAYWDAEKGNPAKYEESVKLYQQLISVDAQPAYKGELANVFWKMEKPDQAADLYIEIGPWLKQQGRTIELINMREYIKISNAEKGKQLDAIINQ
jgi:hypothetical protein